MGTLGGGAVQGGGAGRGGLGRVGSWCRVTLGFLELSGFALMSPGGLGVGPWRVGGVLGGVGGGARGEALVGRGRVWVVLDHRALGGRLGGGGVVEGWRGRVGFRQAVV